ncbi:M15 family metallopeptidase [Fructobacillus ficulneus]|uniref:D-alanyl-D-alanine carboxypeptidase n=1 Tax=Fructobacillus ficulneus TaxID=157463 RepID=A0A0K8MH42_9LACO|nr:M15 family metallopeptidase [Fructobacillus ficulneus]GAO99204.1 D-alanyl-D-alanine carboxypeptidase [Fructobacillus ficulneus]
MKKSYLIIGLAALLAIGLAATVWAVTSHPSSTSSKNSKQSKSSKQGLPAGVKTTDWDLVLVNKQHSRSSEMSFEQGHVGDKAVNAKIQQAVVDFMNGAQQAGYATTLVSGYRSIEYQKEVFANVLASNKAKGMSDEAAEKATKAVVQTPGSSEHQTGLAIDLAGNDALAKYPGLDGAMDQFASQQWLIKHAPEYGFILRYGSTKEDRRETGIAYESWHFRYVGVKNAEYITKHHLTLEAYLAQVKKQNS